MELIDTHNCHKTDSKNVAYVDHESCYMRHRGNCDKFGCPPGGTMFIVAWLRDGTAFDLAILDGKSSMREISDLVSYWERKIDDGCDLMAPDAEHKYMPCGEFLIDWDFPLVVRL